VENGDDDVEDENETEVGTTMDRDGIGSGLEEEEDDKEEEADTGDWADISAIEFAAAAIQGCDSSSSSLILFAGEMLRHLLMRSCASVETPFLKTIRASTICSSVSKGMLPQTMS
jgi:hypothetical protein